MNITTVGIIGAGTMGNGIAQACAASGIKVVMVDISEAAVAKGIATVSGSLDRLLKKEKITVKVQAKKKGIARDIVAEAEADGAASQRVARGPDAGAEELLTLGGPVGDTSQTAGAAVVAGREQALEVLEPHLEVHAGHIDERNHAVLLVGLADEADDGPVLVRQPVLDAGGRGIGDREVLIPVLRGDEEAVLVDRVSRGEDLWCHREVPPVVP